MGPARLLKTGTTIPYTPVAAVSAGDVVDCGTFAGIAIRDIAAGDLGEIDVWDSPTYRVNKYSGEAIAQFAVVYYDAGTNTASGTLAYSEAILGIAASAAAAGDATVDVKLTSP